MTSFNTPLTYQNEGLESVLDFVRWGGTLFRQAQLFYGHGTDNAFDEAKVLVFYGLHLPANIPDHYWQARLTLEEKQVVTELLQRRIETRQPAAYLTGEAWFAGLRFIVNEHTLVPRSPIAELIAQKFVPWVEPDQVNEVLDLCTGSGCIGIACLQAFDNASVDLADISPQALEVAKQNIALYQLEGIAQPIESDLFAALPPKQYDLIVSNPPYVDEIEMHALPEEYRREPQLGLAAGKDGLNLVRKILAQASQYLKPNGVLVVEVGVSQYYVEQYYPELPLYWFDFKHGGEGVFAIYKEELDLFQVELDNKQQAC